MEMEAVIGILIAVIVVGLSIFILRKMDVMPEVVLPEPKLPCPGVEVNLTQQEFHRALMQAKTGCDFNATLKFVVSDELLVAEAEALGLVDEQGKPTVLKTSTCDLPFKALIVCNGTLFPGDRARVYSRQAVIIEKLGR